MGLRSGAYVELLLEAVSKWPDRLPRRPTGMTKPESLREVGVSGRGGNIVDVGESFGEGGVLPFVVELVDGRWPSVLSIFGGWKALNMRDFAGRLELLSPNEVESRPTYFAR